MSYHNVITAQEEAKATDLTLRATVKTELGITTTDDDAFIDALIKEATDTIQNMANRDFARREVREKFQGSGRTEQVLSGLPVKAITRVAFDGTVIDSSEYEILNKDAGIIYRDALWKRVSRQRQWLNQQPMPGEAEPLWEVDYVKGFLLPGDNIENSPDISASTTDNSFNDSNSNFPLLTPGELFDISGFSDSSIDGTYTVSSRTKSKIIVEETIPASDSGGTIDLTVRNLPYDLERLAKDVVKRQYKTRNLDPSMFSEKIGETSYTRVQSGQFAGSGSEVEASPIIRRYRVTF